MVYRRYFIAEILKPAGAVFLLVVAVYSCDCAIVYLDESQTHFDTSGLSPNPFSRFDPDRRIGCKTKTALI